MSQLLAAVDDSAAAGPVISVARWLGGLLDLEVVALHVREDRSGTTARQTAEAASVKFEVREGDPVHSIRAAAADADVRALVVGARGLPAEQKPAGHVALDLIQRLAMPLVVVPPDARVPARDGPLRMLAPVDAERSSADALRRLLDSMQPVDIDLVLLHVFDARHVPMFANHGSGDIEMWSEELVRRTTRSLQAQTRVETRVGHPAHTILAVERELDPDLVALSWAGNLSHGRAAVIKRLLAHATTPLVLLPVVDASTTERPDGPASGGSSVPPSTATRHCSEAIAEAEDGSRARTSGAGHQ